MHSETRIYRRAATNSGERSLLGEKEEKGSGCKRCELDGGHESEHYACALVALQEMRVDAPRRESV